MKTCIKTYDTFYDLPISTMDDWYRICLQSAIKHGVYDRTEIVYGKGYTLYLAGEKAKLFRYYLSTFWYSCNRWSAFKRIFSILAT